jgi:predicted membrane channel-forming protein YqfA (hemolysin III family)
MSDDSHHQSKFHKHAHRKLMARVYLVGILILICAADALLFWFTLSQHNPWRILIGLMFGQVTGSILLFAGIWNRMPWARYVLMVLIFGVISIFAMLALYLSGRPEVGDQRMLTLIWAALGLLVIANTWLIRSKRIQYLASQPGAAGK